MKKLMILVALLVNIQSAFSFEATAKTMASVSVEIIFSTAISSITFEISSFSTIQSQKIEAQKVLREVQEYNQSGVVTNLVASKISIIQTLDDSLSIDESIDVLIHASEIILAK